MIPQHWILAGNYHPCYVTKACTTSVLSKETNVIRCNFIIATSGDLLTLIFIGLSNTIEILNEFINELITCS